MNLKNDQELANTKEKLDHLEARYETLRTEATENTHVRDLTMRSLKRLINQMKEEIARYETSQPARS